MSPHNPKALRPSPAIGRAHAAPVASGPGRIQVRIALLTALTLIAIISLYPYLQTGFTTKDDSELALMAAHPDQWFDAASKYAVFQARFYLLYTLIVYYLVHYVSIPAFYYLVHLGSILLNVLVYYFLLRTVFKSRLLPVLAAALCLAYFQNHWQHSLLTSYPVVLPLGLTALFLAGICFYKWQTSRRLHFAVLTGIAYFCAILQYEAFLPYSLVFLALSIQSAWSVRDQHVTQKAWSAAKILSPVIVASVCYLVFYVAFLFYHPPSRYTGTQFSWRGIPDTAAVIWQYTSSTLPGYFYFFDRAATAGTFDGFGAPVKGLTGLLAQCRTEWLLKAVLVSALCGLILLQKRRVFSARSFSLAAVCGGACMVAPVLLLGFTVKYQDWVLKAGSRAHAPSYFAYFATIFLICATLLFINQKLVRWRFLSGAYILVVSIAAAVASLATDYYNYYITLDQQLSHLKWRTIDRFIQTDDFKVLRNDSIIFAPSLWQRRGIVENDEAYWSRYFTGKSGRRIWVARDSGQFGAFLSSKPRGKAYFLALRQEPKEPNQFLVFSKLERDRPFFNGGIYSNEFVLFSYSKNKSLVLAGESPPGGQPAKVYVNGRAADKVEGRTFVARIDQSYAPEDFPKTTVSSTTPIDLARLFVSYFPVKPGPREIEIVYRRGFHGSEENPAAGLVWNWSLAESELSFVSYSEQPVEKSIEFQLVALTPRTVTVEINGLRQEIRLEEGETKMVNLVRVNLQPGANNLVLTSDQPARPPGNGDPRPMAFCVRNLRIVQPGE